YTFATTGWYLITGPTPAPLANTPSHTSRVASTGSLSVPDIAAKNLFGHATAVGTAPAPVDAPETRLRLTLEGIFLAELPEESAAIVFEPSRPGELVLVGGKLPGGATLREVHADRIVLNRNGVTETLRFPDQPTLVSAQDRGDMMAP